MGRHRVTIPGMGVLPAGHKDDELMARRAIVRGHVQGVFFRHATRAEAERRGVVGWVANLRDGSVEAHLEGPADAVQQVIEFCSRGPQNARVAGVEITEVAPRGFSGFEVR
jgi:acylphosphatase